MPTGGVAAAIARVRCWPRPSSDRLVLRYRVECVGRRACRKGTQMLQAPFRRRTKGDIPLPRGSRQAIPGPRRRTIDGRAGRLSTGLRDGCVVAVLARHRCGPGTGPQAVPRRTHSNARRRSSCDGGVARRATAVDNDRHPGLPRPGKCRSAWLCRCVDAGDAWRTAFGRSRRTRSSGRRLDWSRSILQRSPSKTGMRASAFPSASCTGW